MTTRTYRRAAAVAALGLMIGCGAVHAQDSEAEQRGRATYDYHCAPCHGAGPGDDGRAMLPGTAALHIKYGGALPALLEERSDLTAAVLRVFVRQGSWSMPPFRPTEVTDSDIEDIAAYLAQSARGAGSSARE
jgi:mono/diheme cytochrome c family protein